MIKNTLKVLAAILLIQLLMSLYRTTRALLNQPSKTLIAKVQILSFHLQGNSKANKPIKPSITRNMHIQSIPMCMYLFYVVSGTTNSPTRGGKWQQLRLSGSR